MELIVFDLDGTLLNQDSAISNYTSETLRLLAEHEIAYTVATGRTLHGARAILEGHQFLLPQAYKNGVMIWHPEQRQYSSGAMLTVDELGHIVHACIQQGVTPFVFTLEEDQVMKRGCLLSCSEPGNITQALTPCGQQLNYLFQLGGG